MKVIIIDDEKNSREIISTLINNYCPELDIIGSYGSGKDALKALNEGVNPDLIFLDIQMPNMNGFSFLDACSHYDFYVVFITAHVEYSLKAIKHQAFDYILKPISRGELIETVKKVLLAPNKNSSKQILALNQFLSQPRIGHKISVSTIDGIHIIDLKNIYYVKGEGSYSVFYLENNKKLMVSKVLKEIENSLSKSIFFRVHASYIVNLNHVNLFQRGDSSALRLTNDTEIPVSRSKRAQLIEIIKNIDIQF